MNNITEHVENMAKLTKTTKTEKNSREKIEDWRSIAEERGIRGKNRDPK
jgi:hypothetical protein